MATSRSRIIRFGIVALALLATWVAAQTPAEPVRVAS